MLPAVSVTQRHYTPHIYGIYLLFIWRATDCWMCRHKLASSETRKYAYTKKRNKRVERLFLIAFCLKWKCPHSSPPIFSRCCYENVWPKAYHHITNLSPKSCSVLQNLGWITKWTTFLCNWNESIVMINAKKLANGVSAHSNSFWCGKWGSILYIEVIHAF